MSFELQNFQLSHGVKLGASQEDQIIALRVDQRLHSFSFEARGAVKSGITVRPIQSGLGIISSLGTLSMVDNSLGKEALGLPTGMNMISGGLDWRSASKRQNRAEQIGDDKEVSVEKVGKLEGAIRAIAGFAAEVFCSSQIRCRTGQLSSGVSVGSLAAKVASCSGFIESAAFGISSSLDAGISAYRFYETYRFRSSFEAAEERSDLEGLTCLVDNLRMDSSAQLKTIRAGWENLQDVKEKEAAMAAFKADLEKQAFDALSGKGLYITTEKQLSPSEARERFLQYFQDLKRLPSFERKLKESYAASMKLTPEECSDFSLAALVGFFTAEGKRELRQEAKMIRCTSSCVVEAVQRAAFRGLQERLRGSDLVVQGAKKEYEVLSNTVKETMAANQTANRVKIAEALVGSAICLISILSLCGLCAAPPLFLSLLLVVFTIVVNRGAIAKALKEGPVGKYDRLYLLLISAMLIISFATGLGLYLSLHLVGVELLKVIAIGVVEILMTAYAFYALNKREKAWKEAHPDLEQFRGKITDLPQGPLTEEVEELFNRLPKEDQLAVKTIYQDLPFQSERYRYIDQSYSFGSYFLEQNFESVKEIDLFQRGVEKSLESCWSAYQENQTQAQLEIAFKVQALFEAISRRDKVLSMKALDQLYQHAEFFSQMIDNVGYEFKKKESVGQLLKVIESIQSQREEKQRIII